MVIIMLYTKFTILDIYIIYIYMCAFLRTKIYYICPKMYYILTIILIKILYKFHKLNILGIYIKHVKILYIYIYILKI